MSLRALVALAALLLLLAPGAALADDLRLSVTDTLLSEWRGDNRNGFEDDDDYGVLVNRLNVLGAAGDLSAALRVDSALFFDAPSDAFRDELRLERITVRYDLGDWYVTGGDYHRQLGRGIVLSLRKVDELGRDVSLQGGEVGWRGDDLSVGVFAGRTNPVNLDAINQKHVEDAEDVMAGLASEVRLHDRLRLGLFGLYHVPDERLLDDERDWTGSGGGSLSWRVPGDAVVLYAEGAAQQRALAGKTSEGYAGYLTADVFVGDFNVLLEGLYLQDFEQKGSRNTALGNRFDYNQPPTLERADQEVLDNRDVAGGRVRVEASLLDADLLLHANGMLRFTSPREPDSRVTQLHAYAGGEYAWDWGASRLAASGGYRTESQQGREFKSMTHFEMDWIEALSERLALHVVSTNELRTLEDHDYARGSLFLGLDLSQVGGITFEFGYDTQDPSSGVRNFFYAGILAWHVTDRIEVRTTAGTQRGGIKCISGVCRELPAFAGGRLEAIGRF